MYIFFKYKICYILYVLPIGQKKNGKNKIPKVDIEIIYDIFASKLKTSKENIKGKKNIPLSGKIGF